MCTNEKVKQTFLQHLPVPVQQVVIQSSHNPGFYMLKTNTHADFL